jgi:hypothetical protein
VLGCGLDDQWFKSQHRLGICLFITVSRPALGTTQPPIQQVPGALFLGVKRPGREADHSPPSSAEVKNAWSYASAPQYAFMAGCSIKKKKHRENFSLPLPYTHNNKYQTLNEEKIIIKSK